jgi:deoxyribose-phosphate aldolase
MTGDSKTGADMVAACRALMPKALTLKVIIESGALKEPALIREASEIAIKEGADFVKTSTGKIPTNATLEAAEIILETIREKGGTVGFKASGGIRTVAEAASYLNLAERIMGRPWVTVRHFRFGASSLLDDILSVLQGQAGGKR